MSQAVVSISDSMESRFEDLKQSPGLENMISLLETQTWPIGNINEFGDKEINKIANHFRNLLSKNGCNLNVINEEWQVVKTFMIPLINSNKNSTYLELWKRIFLNSETKIECCNVLHIFELLLFLVQMPNWRVCFRNLLRVKTNWRNQLNRQHLDALLCIGEEGQSIGEFDPNDTINLRFNDKVHCLTALQQKSCYEKQHNVNENKYVDIATLGMSDLEDDDTGFQRFD